QPVREVPEHEAAAEELFADAGGDGGGVEEAAFDGRRGQELDGVAGTVDEALAAFGRQGADAAVLEEHEGGSRGCNDGADDGALRVGRGEAEGGPWAVGTLPAGGQRGHERPLEDDGAD